MNILQPDVETAIEEGAHRVGNVSTAEREGGSMKQERVAIRMWPGGPLRQMAATKVGAFIPFAKTINGCSFAGRYVCDGCQEPCGGVSLSDVGKLSGKRHFKWLCDLCIQGKQRKTRSPEQKQAAIDRLAAARRDRTAAGYSPGAEGCTNTRREEMSISKPVAVVAAVAVDVNPAEEVYGM